MPTKLYLSFPPPVPTVLDSSGLCLQLRSKIRTLFEFGPHLTSLTGLTGFVPVNTLLVKMLGLPLW